MASSGTKNLADLFQKKKLIKLTWAVGNEKGIPGALDTKDRALIKALDEFQARVNELARQYKGELQVRVEFRAPRKPRKTAKKKAAR